ncbi:hypothetical protein DL93DRAFT_849412 [Clavulina sp. PMI_390]|nr:hypothetical protein DL93DRAFT_849412 [Clavulina sp. PMI_390]
MSPPSDPHCVQCNLYSSAPNGSKAFIIYMTTNRRLLHSNPFPVKLKLERTSTQIHDMVFGSKNNNNNTNYNGLPTSCTFTTHDYRNTLILDAFSNEVLYYIESEPRSLFKSVKPTYVYRPSRNWMGTASRELVAEIELKGTRGGSVVYGGRKMKIKEMMPNKGWTAT